MRRIVVMSVTAILSLAFGVTAQLATPAVAASPAACMNQWLFNGIWRVRVTKVEPFMDGAQQVGWQVTEVWRNGANQATSPFDTAMKPQVLELDGGAKMSTDDSNTSTMSNSVIAAHSFPVTGQFSSAVVFRGAPPFDPTKRPIALTIAFDGAKVAQHRFGPKFTTSQPDLHYKLDCTASGTAAAAAGGSVEVPGKEGCLNQWMANGVWRMRVTAIGPDNGDGTQQLGWAVTEEWTNETSRALAPGDTNISDQQLVLTSGNTVASTNSTVSTLSGQKLVYNKFAPGGSLTYTQLFRPTQFDASDKPVKVIIVFDAAAQNKGSGPHYTMPPNYRISLSCQK